MNADDYIDRAAECMTVGDSRGAIENLTSAEKASPDDPLVHAMLFQAYGVTGDFASSKNHLLTLRRLDPKTADELVGDMPDWMKEHLGI
jgi:protein involved in temperature-dependent protein secretion